MLPERRQQDKFVAHQATIKTEKHSEKQPGPHAIEHSRTFHVNESQNTDAGERHLRNREYGCTFPNDAGSRLHGTCGTRVAMTRFSPARKGG